MSILDELLSIENKPYQPIYSGNIVKPRASKFFVEEVNRSKTPRPKTTSAILSSNSKIPNTRPITSSVTSSRLFSRSKSAKEESTLNENLNQSRNNVPSESETESTCLSLLSLGSEEHVVNKNKYGKFEYFSYFERYLNRKAIVKIPAFLMPKVQAQRNEDEPDPTIFDLLDPDEQRNLFEMYSVVKARPFRIRSNSIPRVVFNQSTSKMNTRRSSLSQLSHKYLIKKSKNFNKQSNKIIIDETEFNARAITAPDIYSFGARSRRKKEIVEKKEIKIKRPYSHVESKLGPYISSNRKPNKSHVSIDPDISKKAIVSHDLFKKPFMVYKKKQDPDPNSIKEKPTFADSYLKMSDILENQVRYDVKVNKGPIYFAQLNEENMSFHNNNKKEVTKADKYYYIFNWIMNIHAKECQHFYQNPFVQTQITNTESMENTVELEKNPIKSVVQIGHVSNSIFKIDPFNNPKNQTTINKLPKRHRSNLYENGFFETLEKQTLACTRDYKSLLKLKQNFSLDSDFTIKNDADGQRWKNLITHKSEQYSANKNDLKKQKLLNDVLLTRMQLDLFIL